MNPFLETSINYFDNQTSCDVEARKEHPSVFYPESFENGIPLFDFGSVFESDFDPVFSLNFPDLSSEPSPASFEVSPEDKYEGLPEMSTAPASVAFLPPVDVPPKTTGRRSRKRDFFKPVLQILHSWLVGEREVPLVPNVTDYHLQLAVIIIRRKFCIRESLPPGANCREILEDLFRQTTHKPTLKRTEEKNKFVFKHTVKLMKEAFRAKMPSNSSMKDLNKMFFDHYFGSHSAESEQLRFLDTSAKTKVRSLSLSGLKRAFDVAKFRNDFLKYLNCPTVTESLLLQSYFSIIPKKLNKLFLKWERRYAKNPEPTKAQIMQYFRENTQCKLPWTVHEIVSAVNTIFESAGSS